MLFKIEIEHEPSQLLKCMIAGYQSLCFKRQYTAPEDGPELENTISGFEININRMLLAEADESQIKLTMGTHEDSN